MDERLNNLETIVAMQDETIATLNRELFNQQQSAAKLQRRLERLELRMAQIQPDNDISGNERPPHY